MANGSIISKDGKKIMLNRTYEAVPTYSAPTVFKLGILNGTPLVADTNLDYAIPIEDGTTCDDGSNTLTGSTGGDNSTDNTTTYKEGAGNSDVTSQNLIANGTSASKIWTIADLDTAGDDAVGTQPYALWLYIKDATALAKLVSAGTAISIKFRTNGDAANKYYEDAFEDGDVAVGWNWITSNTTIVTGLTAGAGGAPSGVLDEFVITITTNNATDTFVAGDVIYDLLRQWATSDLTKSFVSGYPTYDYTNSEVTIRCLANSTEANGFDINSDALFNTDTTVLLHSEDVFTAESKSSTDEIAFIVKDREI